MASSTHTKDAVSFNTADNSIAFKLNAKESMKCIHQPYSSDETVMKILQRQMLIPFVVDKKLVTFHGPLVEPKSSPKAVQDFFPGYGPAAPPSFDKAGVIDVRFMDSKARVFRSMLIPGNKEYLAWLNKVQRKCQDQWRSAGIFYAIQIFRYAHRINPCMLLASMYI